MYMLISATFPPAMVIAENGEVESNPVLPLFPFRRFKFHRTSGRPIARTQDPDAALWCDPVDRRASSLFFVSFFVRATLTFVKREWRGLHALSMCVRGGGVLSRGLKVYRYA